MPPLAEALPHIVEHGVRQIALSTAVLNDPDISGRLPEWFNPKLFTQGLLACDTGLALLPVTEVNSAYYYGRPFVSLYMNHPRNGYGMALEIGTPDEASQAITALIARHHMIQAKRQYGLPWHQIHLSSIQPGRIDLLVALQKPFDFFDDAFDRRRDLYPTHEELVDLFVGRFIATFDDLRTANRHLEGASKKHAFDPELPIQVAEKIKEYVLGATAIGEVYLDLRTNLGTEKAE